MKIREAAPDPGMIEKLIELSQDWEAENNCRGYRKNAPKDIEGRRIFVCEEEGRLIGYIFGRTERAEEKSSVIDKDAPFFELEELYVVQDRRSEGIGRALFAFAENAVKDEVGMIMLSTASCDARRILHFYLDELGMEFWSARLFKRIK